MKKIVCVLSILMLALVLTACSASKGMSPGSYVSLPENRASVTFYRTGIMEGAGEAPILEKKGERAEVLGILSRNTKIRCIVRPGFHTFAVVGETAHQLSGELSPGKNYYVRVESGLGLFKKSFALVPISDIRIADEQEQEDILKCNLLEKNALADEWYRENFASVQGKLLTAKYEAQGEGVKAARIHKFYGIKPVF